MRHELTLGALQELSALSLHYAQPQLTAKQFPTHYAENALAGVVQAGA